MLRAAYRLISQTASRAVQRQRYLRTGQRPWTSGYWDYRQDFIRSVLADPGLGEQFRPGQQLRQGYGVRLDERVVEYPWLVSRLAPAPSLLMDAGSALNHGFLLSHPALSQKTIVIYNLAPEGTVSRPNVSYIYGDLRQTILKDQICDEVACISTLEHVGMNNRQLYTRDNRYDESRPSDYRTVMRELRRVLVPGGRLLLTVPYGKYQNFGWMQQFDGELLADAVRAFDGTLEEQTFYRYTPGGWVLADAAECAGDEYYDIRAARHYDPDYAAAARAVACLVLS